MYGNNLLPTKVDDSGLTALIENLGRDCLPTQFIREFTKNSIEACQRTGEKNCKVIIDFNKQLKEKLKSRPDKICFVDTGDGMTGDQMIHLLNSLSASGSEKNQHKNYGVGAKIAALTRNHSGIQYESWRDGVGHMVMIKYDPNECVYGIEGHSSEGETHYVFPLQEDDKPSEITTNGTRVTLYGMSDGQDTMIPPEGMNGIKESWIALYLNTRFFRFPNGVNVSARIGYFRENNPKHNYLLNIKGQKKILDEKAEIKGEEQIINAKLYWWAMPKGIAGHGRETLKGHTALVNQDEIFDVSDARSSRISHFGVIFGRDRVIIYVEPNNVEQNTTRTNLVRPDGSPVLWDSWQDEFRDNMPKALKDFLEKIQDEDTDRSHTDSIKDRLKDIKDLYKLSRYRENPTGSLFGDPNSESESNTGHIKIGSENPNPSPLLREPKKGRDPGSLSTTILTALAESKTVKVNTISPDPFPEVKWVHVKDNEQLKDRAAEYIQPSNLVLANKDFQGLTDLINYISKSYSKEPAAIKVITDEVLLAFETSLTETVAGALALKNRAEWTPADFEAALSKEALTTALMQRLWMVSSIKRSLGSRLKKECNDEVETIAK